MSIMRHVRPCIESVIVPIKEGIYGTFKGFPDSKTDSKVDSVKFVFSSKMDSNLDSVKFVFSNEGQIYLKYIEDCNELKVVISNNANDIIDISIPLKKLRGNDEVECIMEAISEELDLILSYHEMLMDDLMGEN